VTDYVETLLGPRISTVPRSGASDAPGHAAYGVRVQVDPDKLRAQAIGLNDISSLARVERQSSTGAAFGRDTYTIRSNGLLQSPDDLFQARTAHSISRVIGGPGRPAGTSGERSMASRFHLPAAWLYTKTSKETMLT